MRVDLRVDFLWGGLAGSGDWLGVGIDWEDELARRMNWLGG